MNRRIMTNTAERIEWIDIAKGFGIILVVIGHCVEMNSFVFRYIFTFHMPLFFFLSGYVYRKLPFEVALSKKAKSLLVPYAVFFSLGLVVTIIVPMWRNIFSISHLLDDLWLGNPDNIHNSSIWFLLCLFFVDGIYRLIDSFGELVAWCVIIVFFSLGIYYSRTHLSFLIFKYDRLPFNLDVVPSALLFFAIGVKMERINILNEAMTNVVDEIGLFVGGGIGVWVACLYNGYVNMHGLDFGNSIYYLGGALAGTFSVIALAKMTVRLSGEKLGKRVRKVLAWYGRNSLIILGTQSIVIRLYIVANHQFLGRNIVLYHFTWKHSLAASILTAGIFCPIICAVWNFLKRSLWVSLNR